MANASHMRTNRGPLLCRERVQAGSDYSQPVMLDDHVQRTWVEKLGDPAYGIAVAAAGICGIHFLSSRNNRHHVPRPPAYVQFVMSCPLSQ